MWQYIITLLLVIIVFLGIVVGKSLLKNSQQNYIESHYSQCIADGKLERKEIQRLLKNLPATTDRDLDQTGAMCYKMAAPPNRVEYSCPNCGEKTLYILEELEKSDGDAYGVIRQVDREIDQCRRSVAQIKGIAVELDEKQFCKKCSPDVKLPVLALNITLPGETPSRHVEGITLEDIKLLIEFTQGSIIHKGFHDEETLLKTHQRDLERLLGVSATEK